MKLKNKESIDKFVEFLKGIRMSTINQCLLNFNEQGLYISVMSDSNTHQSVGLFDKSNFEEYVPIGNIGIDAFEQFINVFKKMGDEIELGAEGNLMIIKGKNKQLEFELVDEKYIEKIREIPTLEHTTTATIPVKKIIEFLGDASQNKDTRVIIKTVNDGVILTNTGKYKFTYNIDSPGTVEGVTVKFGEPFQKVFSTFKDGDYVLSLKTNYPMVATYKQDTFNMKLLVAPIQD